MLLNLYDRVLIGGNRDAEEGTSQWVVVWADEAEEGDRVGAWARELFV